MNDLAAVLVQVSDMHREIAAHRVEAERRERLGALLARAEGVGAVVDPLAQWVEAQDARKIKGASAPARRAGLLAFAAVHYHVAALASIVEAGKALGDGTVFGAACDAAGSALDLAMARAAQAAEAASNAEARGRCGNRTNPDSKQRGAALESQIQELANQPGTARALSEGVAGTQNGIPLSADRIARRVSAVRKRR